MTLLTHRPGPPLASYIEALWSYDGGRAAPHKERVLPNGGFQSVIDLAAGPAEDFYNQAVPLDPVWGPRGTPWCDRWQGVVTVGERFREAVQHRAERRLALHPSLSDALREFWQVRHIGPGPRG